MKILVGRREVAVVESGTHVGEMAAIEALPRSATVAADGVVVLRSGVASLGSTAGRPYAREACWQLYARAC
ncbi:hypothetical protein [Paraburkholderia phenazinium]|uniref:hypothetical protein n=1 Tax=Paraburkholderia phenazinium TaxID=60549 RepID=UPI003CC62C50